MRVYVEGPYTGPSSSVFTCQHAVLVATGIGVTPFSSILQSLVERIRSNQSLGCIQRLDFVWVNRDFR